MPQAIWVGDLSFGLVNIPVKLYNATSPKRVRFHHYEAGTGRRIRYARVATGPAPEQPPPQESDDEPDELEAVLSSSTEGAPSTDDAIEEPEHPSSDDQPEVPWEDVVKGFEIEPGRVVTVTPEELVSVAPERSRLLEVEQFVDLGDIDPVYFEKSYYAVPQGRGAERPYWLLHRAMEAEGKVAVGRFVMRTKEYLAAIRPAEHVLVLETLFYADEVRDPKEVWFPLIEEPSERELRAARHFIEALAGEWEPARQRDEHRERLLELLRGKTDEAVFVPAPDEGTPTESITDLLAALEASVEAAKRSRSERKQTG
jgi:DNA end-binding protein Ku